MATNWQFETDRFIGQMAGQAGQFRMAGAQGFGRGLEQAGEIIRDQQNQNRKHALDVAQTTSALHTEQLQRAEIQQRMAVIAGIDQVALGQEQLEQERERTKLVKAQVQRQIQMGSEEWQRKQQAFSLAERAVDWTEEQMLAHGGRVNPVTGQFEQLKPDQIKALFAYKGTSGSGSRQYEGLRKDIEDLMKDVPDSPQKTAFRSQLVEAMGRGENEQAITSMLVEGMGQIAPELLKNQVIENIDEAINDVQPRGAFAQIEASTQRTMQRLADLKIQLQQNKISPQEALEQASQIVNGGKSDGSAKQASAAEAPQASQQQARPEPTFTVPSEYVTHAAEGKPYGKQYWALVSPNGRIDGDLIGPFESAIDNAVNGYMAKFPDTFRQQYGGDMQRLSDHVVSALLSDPRELFAALVRSGMPQEIAMQKVRQYQEAIR